MFYICEKFHDNISNGFQLTERTRVHGRNGYVQYLKDNNSKSRQTRVKIYMFCSRLIVFYICVRFGENIFEGMRVMERTRMMEVLTDDRTDRRMDGHSKFRTV